MSVAEDVRKVLQEVVVPDLKAIDERIKGLEQPRSCVTARFRQRWTTAQIT
jgi:hypothetical protein